MTTFRFQTHVSESGVMALPPLPETFYGENISVKIDVSDQLQRADVPPRRSFEELCGVWGHEEDREDVDRMVAAIHESRLLNTEREQL